MRRLVDDADAADDVAKEHDDDEVRGDCRRGAGRNPCAADIIDTTKERDSLGMIFSRFIDGGAVYSCSTDNYFMVNGEW